MELSAGRIGVTDFSIARRIATDTISMIRIANNMEGAQALSEEFSHLIIGALRDKPLITRSLDILAQDEEALKEILGDEYQDTMNFHSNDMSLVAEEALGKLLQKNLQLQNSTKSSTLLGRFLSFVKNLFRRMDMDRVHKAINDADAAMSVLAKDILSGKTSIRREDIANAQREVQFNALSDRIQRNIDILNAARQTEIKRYKISGSPESKDSYEELIWTLGSYANKEADTVKGIFTYAQEALKELRIASANLRTLNQSSTDDMFSSLRTIKSILQSYGGFLAALNDAANEESDENDNMFIRKFTIDVDGHPMDVDIRDTIKELNTLME